MFENFHFFVGENDSFGKGHFSLGFSEKREIYHFLQTRQQQVTHNDKASIFHGKRNHVGVLGGKYYFLT